MIEKYSSEYKDMCVDLVIKKKYTLKDAAAKTGVPPSSISDWVQSYKKNKKTRETIGLTSYKKYSQQLEKEILQLNEDILFLKKRCTLLLP